MNILGMAYFFFGYLLSRVALICAQHVMTTTHEAVSLDGISKPPTSKPISDIMNETLTSMKPDEAIVPEITTHNSNASSVTTPAHCTVTPTDLNMPLIILFHLLFGVISLVVNALSITVHRKKTMQMTIILIVLCIADICQGATNLGIAIWDMVKPEYELVKYLFDMGTFGGFWLGLMIVYYLERVSQALNALMCVDRFLVLSGSLGSVSIIQRHAKRFSIGVWLVILAMMTIDAYGYSVSNITFPVNSCPDIIEGNNVIGWNETTTISDFPTTTPSLGSNITTITIYSLWIRAAKIAPMVSNFVIYALLLIVIILNVTTHILLQVRQKQRRWLTEGKSEKQQSNILLVMTSVYAFLAIPTTSFKLVGDFSSLQIIKLPLHKFKLFLDLVRVGAIFDQIKNTSDFFVFLIMSRMFRRSIMKSLGFKGKDAFSRTSTERKTMSFSKD